MVVSQSEQMLDRQFIRRVAVEMYGPTEGFSWLSQSHEGDCSRAS